MAQLWWKSDRPEPGVLLALAFAAVASAATWNWAHRAPRPCPSTLPDGRPLLGIDTRAGRHECRYGPIARPALSLSPTELRRMARQREIMK